MNQLLPACLVPSLQRCRGPQTRGAGVIELTFALGIFTVLLGIVAPGLWNMRTRARQAEVKLNLRQIFTATKSHYARSQSHVCGDCGVTLSGRSHRYRYVLSFEHTLEESGNKADCQKPRDLPQAFQSASSFRALAIGNIDADGTCDVWSIDESNVLTHVLDDVAF